MRVAAQVRDPDSLLKAASEATPGGWTRTRAPGEDQEPNLSIMLAVLLLPLNTNDYLLSRKVATRDRFTFDSSRFQ